MPTSPERTTHVLVKDSRQVGAVVDFTLIAVVLAFAVGLSMVVVSLEPLERATHVTLTARHARIAQGSAASRGSDWGVAPTHPTPQSADWAGTSGPWTSPLFPQNGVTLWDRIRVSSKHDRRAFLLGTAIQLHTPAIAATPGPQFAPPTCCPRT